MSSESNKSPKPELSAFSKALLEEIKRVLIELEDPQSDNIEKVMTVTEHLIGIQRDLINQQRDEE